MPPLPRYRASRALRALIATVLGALLCAGPAASAVEGGAVPRPVGGLAWPVEPPVTVVRAFEAPAGPYSAGHRGVDLAVAARAPVRASAAGTVVVAGDVAGRPLVVIAHGPARTADELRTTYDAVRPSVSVGRRVARGEAIGTVVRSEHCTARCLHWGLRRGQDYLDPLARTPVRLLPVGPPVPIARGGGTPRVPSSVDEASSPVAVPVGDAPEASPQDPEITGGDARRASWSTAALAAGAATIALAQATRVRRRTPLPRGSSP